MQKIVTTSIQIILSALFILSGITKLISLEQFELFVYNISNIGFDASSLVARAIIGLELIIGVFIIYKKYYAAISALGIAITIAFSGFLIAHLQLDNCYCFGPNFPFTAKESLVKNAGILALFIAYILFINKYKFSNLLTIPKKIIILLAALLFAIPFIYNPANCIIRLTNMQQSNLDFYKITDTTHVSKIKHALSYYNITNSHKQIVGIMSSQCKHCKQANKMLVEFNNKYNFAPQTTLLIIGDSMYTKQFLATTSKDIFATKNLHADLFMDISKGVLPMFLFIKNNKYYLLNAQSLCDQILVDYNK